MYAAEGGTAWGGGVKINQQKCSWVLVHEYEKKADGWSYLATGFKMYNSAM